jgi:hypothetical protein
MDTRLDLHLHARRQRASGPLPAGVARAAGVAVTAVILAGVAVLILGGHGVSWLAGLVAGAAAAAWLTVGRGRAGSRPASGAQRRTELAVQPLEQAGWSFLHGVPGPNGTYDHIAVGPGGLILLQSICPDGVVKMIGADPMVEQAAMPAAPAAPGRLERLRPTALADATSLRERVQQIAERRMWVQAVVVVWSEFPAGCVADGRCVYIHGSRLAEWMSRRPHQFDEAETAAVGAAVRELAARGAEVGLRVAV